ncbi:nickel ABC transporter permease [Paenibacillus validus]|uniref:Nickel import system permease protein NikB n=1 Tax=Paenibacillus validus TaxID=44253 RepID=A0A7X2ZC79_9BACL|nr:nickel ABC transporter permease [Paenibacillus validus]MUG72186.1 ABC transporter permease subunit [Paenibacillus validus]
MLRLVKARMLQLVVVLFILSLVTFSLMKLAPGDPVLRLLRADEVHVTQADEAALREELGLNRPIYVQYLEWMSNLLRLDFGDSLIKGKPVLDEMADRLPATVQLTMGGLAVMLLLAVPLGMLASKFPGGLPDQLGRIFALIGASMPLFWVGLIMIYIFAFKLQWFPTMGHGGWREFVLPSVSLGFGLAAVHARLLRSGMLDSLSQEYIRAGRARGISEWRIFFRHALRAALIPVLTVFGMTFGSLVAGSVVIETLFSWPGLGSMAVEAIFQRDYPLVQGYLMLCGAFIIIINLVVDLIYGILDPRIRLHKGGTA